MTGNDDDKRIQHNRSDGRRCRSRSVDDDVTVRQIVSGVNLFFFVVVAGALQTRRQDQVCCVT